MLKKNEKVYAVVVWKNIDITKKILILCKTKETADEVAKSWKDGKWDNTKIIEMKICKSSEEGMEGINI